MAERDLVVRFIGDDRDLQRAFTRQGKQVKGFQTQMAGVGSTAKTAFGAAGIAVGGGVIVQQLKSSVNAASDLNEQISRTEVILGDSADEMVKWSTTTADAMGISQRAALAATATFAGLFQTVGVNQKQAGDLSRSLVQLAADLASLQNSSPEEALIALRSGLAGEAEPLRRFNIFLSEARVQQEAMAASGKRNASALTQQEKTLARYNLILRDAAPAMGNFKQTSGELANQQRILRANFDDLSTRIGSVFIPTLESATSAALLLFDALDKFRGVDFSPGFEFPDLPDWLTKGLALAPISPAGAIAVGLKEAFEEEEKKLKAPAAGPGKGIGEDIARRQREATEDAEKAAADVKRNRTRQQKAFRELSRGLGLKLDRAGLTDSLDDDIAALRELEAAILRQINREGRTFALVEQLVTTRAALAQTIERQAQEAADRSRQAFQNTIDAIDLRLERALDTPRLDDDLRALAALEAAIRKRIAAEGKTLELERQLLDVRRQQAQTREELADQLRQQRQGRQFEALGLTEEGEKRGPSTRNLKTRLGNLREQIEGTFLDTAKTQAQLDRIAKVLSGKFGKVGKDVRSAILQMLNDIASAFKDGTKDTTKEQERSSQEITRGGIRSTKKLVEGLGLTQKQIDAIRRRNRGGLGGGATAFGFAVNQPTSVAGSAAGFGGGLGAAMIITGPITVVTDDPDEFMRKLQKKGARSAPSRRGRHGARNLGLG